MGGALDSILAGERFVNGSGVFRAAVDLYKLTEGARDQPEAKLKATIANLIAQKLLDLTHLGFLQVVFDQGTFEARKKLGPGRELELPNVKVPLLHFRPDVEFVVFVDDEKVEEHVLKISFELDSEVSLDGVRVVSNEGERSLSCRTISVTLDLYFIVKMILGQKKRKIGGKSFAVEGLTLNEKEIRG
jgi:hypothetical protein